MSDSSSSRSGQPEISPGSDPAIETMPADRSIPAVGLTRRHPRRLKVLLALNALLAAIFVYTQIDPRVYDLFKPSPRRFPKLGTSGQRLLAEVRALGGTAKIMGRTQPFLGVFGRSRALVYVRLNGREIDDQAFARLMEKYGADLFGLDIRNTRITDEGLRSLKGLRNLQDLTLGNVDPRQFPRGNRVPVSPITDAGLAHLKELTQLKSLNLSGLPITDAGLGAFKDIPDLVWLYLSRTKIKGPGLGRLKSLPTLAVIYLDDSEITDDGLSFLSGASNLQFLSLNGVTLTAKGLNALQVLPELRTLEINGCGLLDQEVTDFRRSQPDLEIERSR